MKVKTLAAVLGLALLALAAPARAEVVTMVCATTLTLTLDIDLQNKTVFYAAGGPATNATVPIDVTDRYVEWVNPLFPNEFRQRIDRATGLYYTWYSDRGWVSMGTCQRAGKPVL